MAGIFAGLLLCEAPSASGACNSCQACPAFSAAAPILIFGRVKAAGASIGVDEIRVIQSDVAIKPMYSRRKVYIIEEADKMTVQAPELPVEDP